MLTYIQNPLSKEISAKYHKWHPEKRNETKSGDPKILTIPDAYYARYRETENGIRQNNKINYGAPLYIKSNIHTQLIPTS